jgi:hypothetical protein
MYQSELISFGDGNESHFLATHQLTPGAPCALADAQCAFGERCLFNVSGPI